MKNIIIKPSISAVLLSILLFVLSSCSKSDTASWLQFRGPGAKGIAPENTKPPVNFGIDKNILWKIEIPEGFSSPVLLDDNLILTGVNREEKKFFVLNIDCDSGSLRWQREVLVDTLEKVHPISNPAAATPVSDGEFVYVYFPSFGLICYDFDGNIIWERPIVYQQVMTGSGTSPVVSQNKLILNFDNMFKPRLMVFEKSTGELTWEYEFQKQQIMSSTSWSTPVTWENQVIIHRLNKIIGLDLNTGIRKWFFEIGTSGCATPVIEDNVLFVNAWNMRSDNSTPGVIKDFHQLFEVMDANKDGYITKEEFRMKFPEGMNIHDRQVESENFFTKFIVRWGHFVGFKGRFSGFDYDKNNQISENEWQSFLELMSVYANQGLVAIRLGDTENITLSGQLWKTNENIPETPSVLVKNGLVYMVKNGGTVTCVNIENGDIVYAKKLGATGAYFASPLYADGYIFIASFNGKISILKEGNTFEIVNQIDLDAKIGASPVAIGNKLFIRTAKHLYAFQE